MLTVSRKRKKEKEKKTSNKDCD